MTASTRRAHGEPMSRSDEPQQLEPGAVVEHQVAAAVPVDGGGELEDDAEVVGQLGVVELEARRAGRSA